MTIQYTNYKIGSQDAAGNLPVSALERAASSASARPGKLQETAKSAKE